jgi:hypothetical protein
LNTALSEESTAPPGFRIAQILVWVAFGIQLSLTIFMIAVPTARASFLVALVVMLLSGIGINLRAPWGLWLATAVGVWFVGTWTYELAVVQFKPGLSHLFDWTVDAVRFGGFGAAVVLLWLTPVRTYYQRRQSAAT